MSPKLEKTSRHKGKRLESSAPLFELPIREMVLSRKLSYVNRWGTTPTLRLKSVAEHTFYVMRIARWICHILDYRAVKIEGQPVMVDILKVLDMALIHDEEEGLTGDIVHTFKSLKPELEQQIESLSLELLRSEYSSILRGDYFMSLRDEFNQKSRSIEAQIVQVADMIAGLAECEEEIRLGNQGFLKLQQNYSFLLGGISYSWFLAIKDVFTFRGV